MPLGVQRSGAVGGAAKRRGEGTVLPLINLHPKPAVLSSTRHRPVDYDTIEQSSSCNYRCRFCRFV